MPTSNKHLPKIEHYGRPAKRTLSRHQLYASGVEDVARARAAWPPVEAPRSVGLNGYSAACKAVTNDFNPPKNHQYV